MIALFSIIIKNKSKKNSLKIHCTLSFFSILVFTIERSGILHIYLKLYHLIKDNKRKLQNALILEL